VTLLPEEELHRNIGTAIRDLRKKRALTPEAVGEAHGLVGVAAVARSSGRSEQRQRDVVS